MSDDKILVAEMMRATDKLWKWFIISYSACAATIITLATLGAPVPAVISLGVACWSPWIGAAINAHTATRAVVEGRSEKPKPRS